MGGEQYHHVLWAPWELKSSFLATWEMRNLNTEAGLCIVFLAARGLDGAGAFDPSLAPRTTGEYSDYTKGDLASYGISYYSNGKKKPDRQTSNLRKNPGRELAFYPEGIPT